jgi:hypothetical protein
MTTEVNGTSSATVTTAMNGSVEALENATYIPQSIMVTGGAGKYCICIYITSFFLHYYTVWYHLIAFMTLYALCFTFVYKRFYCVTCSNFIESKVSTVQCRGV